jgi:hypothetical protein
VIDEFDPAERVPAELAIRHARDELVPPKYPASEVRDAP